MAERDVGKPDPKRRLLAAGSIGIGGLIGLGLTVPVLGALLHPLRKATMTGGAGEWFRVGALEDFPVGVPQRRDLRSTVRDGWSRFEDVRLGSVWVARQKDDSFVALSAVCPHLGCGISVKDEGDGYACLCHDSDFAPGGAVIAGPSPRPMDTLEVERRDDGVYVRFERFKVGIADKHSA